MKPSPSLVSDAVWCGGTACALVAAYDVLALWKGGRSQVPVSSAWLAVAGILLPLLNLYFIVKDLTSGRRLGALLGAILSALALLVMLSPMY